MAYADYVLSKGPVAYFTLSGSNGDVDITGNGSTFGGYTAGTDSPLVPGYLCGSVTGSTGVSNSLGVLTEPGQQNKYTIELWARLKISAFSGTYSTAYDIVSTATGNSKIYIENSLVTFMLTDDSDNVYRATARHTDFDESMHIAAVYSPDGFFIAVNGVAGDVVTLPRTSKIKEGASTLRLSTANMFVSNLSIYQKTLSISEIQENYKAGRLKLDKASMAVSQGASFYPLSKDMSTARYSDRFDIQDFPYGNIRNLKIEDDKLTIVEYSSALVRDANTISYTPTYSSGVVLGGTPNAKHLMVPGVPGLNSNGGFVGVRLTTSNNTREILSISSKKSRKSLTWSLNATGSTGTLSLVSKTYDVSGAVEGTPSTYLYSTTLPTGTTDIWFLMDSSGVRVSAPSLVSDTFNQVSSSDYVYETILIDDSTEIILGTDDNYASTASTTTPFRGLWIGSGSPLTTTSTTGNLLTANQASGTDTLGTTAGFRVVSGTMTLSSDAVIVKTGAKSLKSNASVGGIIALTADQRAPVLPGTLYTGKIAVKAASGSSGTTRAALAFYNSGGGIISQVLDAPTAAVGSSDWATLSVQGVAPVGAVNVDLFVYSAPVGVFHFDEWGVWAGSGGDWALPGVPITGINPTIVYSDLKSPSVNSSSYNWSSSADMTAKTRGEWTYTFTVSTDGDYSGSYLDFDLSPDSKSKVQIKYNTDVSYTECRRGKFLPSMPYSGTYPAVAQGPITLQVVLESENVIKNVAQLGFVEVSVYADNILGGNHKLGDATLSGSSASVRPGAFIPGESRKRLNCTFSGTGNIVIPGATAGAHRAIEMTFIVEGTRSATGVLASTTGNQINISPSNVVTATGSSWPTGSIYLNGVALSAGSATAKSDSVNHLLIVGSTGSTGSLYINSKNDNSLYVSGTEQYSSYGYLATWATGLTSDQITDILASRNGIVTSQPNMTPDAIAFSEPANATRVNITPWQTVLST
jgi:hypothetical protein